MNFKDDAPTSDDERIVKISGTHESAQQAEVQIRKIIAEQPPIITDVVTVPQKCIGRIIGQYPHSHRSTIRCFLLKAHPSSHPFLPIVYRV